MTNQEAMRGRARDFLLHFHLPPDSHEQVAELLCKFHAQEAAIAKIEDGGVAKERSEQSGNIGKVSGSTPDSPISEQLASRDARIEKLESEIAEVRGKMVRQIRYLLNSAAERWNQNKPELAIVNDDRARLIWQFMPRIDWHEFDAEFKLASDASQACAKRDEAKWEALKEQP